jgi:hypothetical protein
MATTQATNQGPSTAATVPNNIDRYVVIHVATTCDEHGVYVTKDSAEVIEIGWILIDAKTSEEVYISRRLRTLEQGAGADESDSCIGRAF